MGKGRSVPIVEIAALIAYEMGGQSNDDVSSAAGPNLAYFYPSTNSG
jgi:hypothetical protein